MRKRVNAGYEFVRTFESNSLFLIEMYTVEFIRDLISCEKYVTEPPKDKEARSGYTKKVFAMLSVKDKFTFSGFMNQNHQFPENFSIGLTYKPKEERGTIILLRCNGMHGGTIQNPHHASCHIHRVTADSLNQGLRIENDIELTDKYSTFESAIQFYINLINLDPTDRQTYFPPPSAQIDLF